MRTVTTRARVRLTRVRLIGYVLGAALGSVLLATACGGNDDGGGQIAPDLLTDIHYGGDTAQPDVPVTPDEDIQVKLDTGPTPDVPLGAVGRLEFVDRNGDDGVSCVDSNRCSKKFESVEIRPLKVRYFEDDERAPNRAVEYEITRGPAIADLQPANGIAITDENGEASIDLRVKEADCALAQLEVIARIPSRPDVPELHFDVLVDLKCDSNPLTVLPDYVGTQPVDSVKIKLFRQPADPRNPGQYVSLGKTCSELVAYIRDDDEIHMPSADVLSSEIELGNSFAFQDVHFTDLSNDPEQMFTVVAVGQDANRVNRIVGCDEQNALVRYQESRTVVVPMVDLPPRLKGQYEIRSEFDLVSALPDNVEQIVDYILDFFDDPSLTIVRILCDLEQDFTEDLCGYLINSNGTPTTTGTIVLGILDGIIEGLGQGNWFGTTMDVGSDIGRMLRELTFLSVVEFDEEPDEDGWIDPRTTHEDWHAFRYRWTLDIGPACAADPTCGWNEFSLRTIGMQVIDAQFEASVNTAQEGTNPPWSLLTIEEHPLTIKYGALLNWIIKEIVLPRLAGGEPPDGLPRVDDYEKLIKSIMAGRECLLDELQGGPQCCETFAENILGETDIPMAESLVKAACDAVVQFGAGYIENLLVGLDLQTGDPEADNAFVIGTMPDAACRMYDADQNLEIDALGRADKPCQWQVRVRVNLLGGQDIFIDADFWGCRAGTACRL